MGIEVYYSARIDVFMLLKEKIPFDLFIMRSPQKYTCVFRGGDGLDHERFLNYQNGGVSRIYYKATEQNNFLKVFTKKTAEIRETDGFQKKGGVELLDALAEQVFSEVFQSQKCTADNIDTFKELALSYVQIVQNEPHILPDLIRLARLKPNSFKHGILSSIFSTLIARARSPNDSKLQMVCGLTGLLHDIGFSKLSKELDEFDPHIWSSEALEIRRHPQVGAEMLLSTNLPAGVRTAILQHHEACDGSGYPMGLSGAAISLPARVVAIANEFVYLTTGSQKTAPMSVEQAMLKMHADNALDSNLFEGFAKLLLVS